MTKDIEREALITEIDHFINEAKKSYIVERWAVSYENSNPFSHTINDKNEVWWMKAQARQLWEFWQAAIARMEVRINTLDEILLNQGEALAQAKAQAVPDGFVAVNKKDLVKVLNCVTDDLLIDTDSLEEFKKIESLVQDEIDEMFKAWEPAND